MATNNTVQPNNGVPPSLNPSVPQIDSTAPLSLASIPTVPNVPLCSFCTLSEDLAICDIYFMKKCNYYVCTQCHRIHGQAACPTCGIKLSEHEKTRSHEKENLFAKAVAFFNRESRLRAELADLPLEVQHVLLYYHHYNPPTYDRSRKELDNIYSKLQSDQLTIAGNGQLGRDHSLTFKKFENNGDGREACSYQVSERKGIKMVLRAYGMH